MPKQKEGKSKKKLLCSMSWMADVWFSKYYAADLTDDFKVWWLDYYGCPDDYDNSEDEQQEYWRRCAFAWMGWNAACRMK